MIPKIIHYCWLSNDAYPASIQVCIDSWKKKLPDYEFVLWNFDRFPRGKSKWVDQAFDSHKYAFAADYIRLYALYNYGGIYLDSDVEVLKSFDDLLHLPYFIGQENTPSGVEAATLGCEKGNRLIKDLLDFYQGKEFIRADKSYNTEPLPFIFRKAIEAYFTYHLTDNVNAFIYDSDIINIFPVDLFSPKHWQTREINVTQNTYSIHHFAGSWVKENIEKDNSSSENVAFVENESKNNSILRIIIKRLKLKIKSLAFSNKLIASIYFSVCKKDRLFFAEDKLYIYASEYKEIVKLRKAIKNCDIEFIRKEMSKHKESISEFYPIARIVNSSIEIHVFNPDSHVYTKKEIKDLIYSL